MSWWNAFKSEKRGESSVAEVVRLRMSRANDRILTNSATEQLNRVALLRRDRRAVLFAICAAIAMFANPLRAEELWLHDNTRLYGHVGGVSPTNELELIEPGGKKQSVRLDHVIAIRFLGRDPLLIQTGTQEFRFVAGGRLRGQIMHNDGDQLVVQTAMAGEVRLNMAHLKGFVALPLIGFSGSKAEELVESMSERQSSAIDMVLDRRGATYPGVVRRLNRTQLDLDHEELLQVVPIRILYLAGVRLAEAGRQQPSQQVGALQVRLRGRDDSSIQGVLEKIHLGRWYLRPAWDPQGTLAVAVEEIASVQVLGARVQYLSQLDPIKVVETTILAPAQPFRMDQSSQGDAISIAGKRYPWGIGVHADSELTFRVDGQFREFHADVGIDSRQRDRGSVVFSVHGDGKELFASSVVTGREPRPLVISTSIAGVKLLTLKVTNAGDLDLGDTANWGSARVVR